MYGDYPNLQRVKKVLVVKLRHLGDVLLTSPVFSHLQRALPHATIDALVYQESVPMLDGHPALAKCHTYDRSIKKASFLKKWIYEWRLLRAIRSEGYDLVINLTEGDRGALAAWASGARIRVGVDPGKKGFMGKRSCFTHLVRECHKPRHTVEKQLDALRRIGLFPKLEERELYFKVPTLERASMKALLCEDPSYVLIHPVSRWRFKCLPAATMAQLCAALHERGERIVFSSGPDPAEKRMIQEIIEKAPSVPHLNLAGCLSLKELGALIEGARCLITVDTVALHMASALKTPLVALFGPTSEENWGPWQHPKARVVAHAMPCRPCFLDGCGGSKVSDCLTRLQVKQILDAFEAVTERECVYV